MEANNIIDKIKNNAEDFMAKQKNKEKLIQNEMLAIIGLALKKIKDQLLLTNINPYNLNLIRENIIKPISFNVREEMKSYLNSSINNYYYNGIQTGENFIKLYNIEKEPLDVSSTDDEETLFLLQEYSDKLIDGLINDFIGNIDKDVTSIFLLNKNREDFNGKIDSKLFDQYINKTFKNITDRTKTISNTEIIRALNFGVALAYLAYKRNNNRKIRVQWVEIKDAKLCRHCREAAHGGLMGDGIYEINSVTPPPLHPNCRCILIPILY